MKNLKFFIPLFAIAVFIGGCPYASEVAIDNPSVKVNPSLLGSWEKKSSEKYIYTVSKTDDFNYKITRTDSAAQSPSIYKAYMSDVDGDKFLNLQETGSYSEKATYYLYKVELNSSSTRVTLKPLTENIREKFSTSDELKSFIRKNKNLSFFYGKDEEVFYKAD
jgi:hypothetical protein